jgi:hypothetical protein
MSISSSTKTEIPGQVLPAFQELASIGYQVEKRLTKTSEVVIGLQTGFDKTSRVHCIPGTNQFYVSGNSEITKRTNSEGTLLEEIVTTTLGFHSPDMTFNKEGHFVYTNWVQRSINRQKNEKTECLIKLHGWKPRAICSTPIDDLLVTMTSDDFKRSQVVRYSGSTITQEIQHSDTGEPLYSAPDFITENKNLDIVVSNLKTKEFRFGYDRNTRTNKPFDPRGVTTDSMCYILIADCDNHVIHIIDQNGQFIQYIDNLNLQMPHDLSTYSNDELLVTERETGLVKQIKYLELY